MYCETHPKYTGYRRPSNECLSCWSVYLQKKGKTVEEYGDSISSKNPEMNVWLRVNSSDITLAPVTREALVESSLEFVVLDADTIEEFKILPEETVEAEVIPEVKVIDEERIPISGHADPLFYVAKKVADDESEKDEEAPEPQRGRFV